MSWTTMDTDLQTKVLDKMHLFASEETDEALSNAFVLAANELKLWINGATVDPFTVWLTDHHSELEPYAGKAVAVHLEKGIVASAEASAFWDGSFQTETYAAHHNDSNIFITVVPEFEEVSSAEEQ